LDEAEFPAYVDKLRRSLPYWIYAIPGAETRRRLERQMFWDNYKGSTDLLTRYVFPPLVWPMTLFCTRWHIHPNVVTVLSIVLAFAAVPLFAQGSFVIDEEQAGCGALVHRKRAAVRFSWSALVPEPQHPGHAGRACPCARASCRGGPDVRQQSADRLCWHRRCQTSWREPPGIRRG